jgi:nitrous oxide reductase accessory protein NosL
MGSGEEPDMTRINYRNAVPLIALSAALLAACQSKPAAPPEIVVDRTACSHCRMFVSEAIYAAAYRVDAAEPKVFDDIACLVASMRRESLSSDSSGFRVWFQDGNGGGWIERGTPVFVSSAVFRTPMGGGVLAYRDAAAAAQAASTYQGQVVGSLAHLLNRRGES